MEAVETVRESPRGMAKSDPGLTMAICSHLRGSLEGPRKLGISLLGAWDVLQALKANDR